VTDKEKNSPKTDPICLMEVRKPKLSPQNAMASYSYFCSEGCRDKFLKDKTCARTAYDLIILGGGPAGLTAAVYAATLKMEAPAGGQSFRRQAVDSTRSRIIWGSISCTGPELIDRFKHQLLHSHYIDHLMSEVEGLELYEGGFKVTTQI